MAEAPLASAGFAMYQKIISNTFRSSSFSSITPPPLLQASATPVTAARNARTIITGSPALISPVFCPFLTISTWSLMPLEALVSRSYRLYGEKSVNPCWISDRYSAHSRLGPRAALG